MKRLFWSSLVSYEIDAAAAAAAAKNLPQQNISALKGLNIFFIVNKQWFHDLQCMYCTAAAAAAAAADAAAAAAATIMQQKEYPNVFVLIIIT